MSSFKCSLRILTFLFRCSIKVASIDRWPYLRASKVNVLQLILTLDFAVCCMCDLRQMFPFSESQLTFKVDSIISISKDFMMFKCYNRYEWASSSKDSINISPLFLPFSVSKLSFASIHYWPLFCCSLAFCDVQMQF
jgi:hypothetical protein